jgi:hypothetical protein
MHRLAIILAVLGSAAAHAAPMKVFIIAGQSNAVGGGAPSTLEPALAVPQQSLYQYDLVGAQPGASEDWEQLRPLLIPQVSTFGAEVSFGQAMHRRLGEPVAIIKVAANGTALGARWAPRLNDLYPWMMEKVNSSLAQLVDQGIQPDLGGFLWIQHEGDAGVLSLAQAYDDNLRELASTLRTDLAAPTLPFLFNEVHSQLNRSFVNELRQSQFNALAADPLMRMFNADDLTLNPDFVHFTGGMHIEVGRRFADLLLPSADFDNDGDVDGTDLTLVRSSVGISRAGDGNADGVTNGADFLLWQRQVNPVNPGLVVNAVPEPSSRDLLLIWLMTGLLCYATSRAKMRAF